MCVCTRMRVIVVCTCICEWTRAGGPSNRVEVFTGRSFRSHTTAACVLTVVSQNRVFVLSPEVLWAQVHGNGTKTLTLLPTCEC